jgi:hypothetical protein
MNVDLFVERLILDGFSLSRREQALVQAAFEGELTRLLRTGELSESLAQGASLSSVRAPGLQLTTGLEPAQLGIQIARSIYSGIGPPREIPHAEPTKREE